MKKIYLLLFTLIICLGLSAQHQNLTDAANYARYAEANMPFKKRVVFIGNSITEGWVNSNPEFFASNNYIGRGISGQTSPQLLLRFRQDVINLHPTAVVINIGTNDIAENTGAYTLEFTLDCIMSMSELARYNGIKVILSSILPVTSYSWNKNITNIAEKVDALNRQIKTYADSNGFFYIDYNTPMRNADGGMIGDYTRDGVHPSKEGYKKMESIAKAVIEKVLGL